LLVLVVLALLVFAANEGLSGSEGIIALGVVGFCRTGDCAEGDGGSSGDGERGVLNGNGEGIERGGRGVVARAELEVFLALIFGEAEGVEMVTRGVCEGWGV
jgi:hypothetical protein